MTNSNPPAFPQDASIELFGPDDGGWYTTRIHDWIALCPALQDVDVRVYVILRALVMEKFKNPVRKLSLIVLCQLVPGPNGKPSGLTRIRGSIKRLSAAGLLTTPDGKPITTSSRASAAQKVIRIRINDMPAEGYRGWRNAESKLDAINARLEAQEAGRNSDPEGEGDGTEGQTGRNSDPAGCNSDPTGRDSDPDSGAEQPEREHPLVPSLGTASDGDALSARSAWDARRASYVSSGADLEGGCAASEQTSPSPTGHEHTPDGGQAAAASSGKEAKHTRQQLEVVRAVRAFLPAELAAPDVPTLTDAILNALGEGRPDSRTVEQLGKRIERRWYVHGWARRLDEGQTIRQPVGVAIDLVRPYGPDDKWGCAAPRCEDGVDVDTGADCPVCPERLADRQRARQEGGEAVPGQRSKASGLPPWECGSPACRMAVRGPRTATGLCPGCEEELERAAAHLQAAPPAAAPEPEEPSASLPPKAVDDEETARLRAYYARQFGNPEQVEAYCATAPF